MTTWNNKVVVVTGGSSGLGKAIGLTFAAKGAKSILLARDEQKLKATAQAAVDDGLDLDWIVADVTDQSSVESAFREIVQRHQRIDILVNNVGKSTRMGFKECTVEEYKALLEVNFYSAVRCTLAALEHLEATSGQIVNIGSLASKTGWPNVAPYSTSKHALSAFSHQLRLEGPSNVNCLQVCSGPIKRDDSGVRYQEQAAGLSDSAKQPGAGVKLKGIDPTVLANKIVRGCERRKKDMVIPMYCRILFAIQQISPNLGDFLLRVSNKN